MLNRLAGSQPAWTCAWASLQIRGIGSSTSSHADASEAGSRQRHAQQDTHDPGSKRKNKRKEGSLYDELYNVYFQDLNAGDSQRNSTWDRRASAKNASSSSSSSRSRASSPSQSTHQASSSSRDREAHQGKRGMSWFAQHWAGAGLSLDDIENLAFLQRQPGRSRSRRNQGAGSRSQETKENVWEDESGFRWTEARAASSSRSYQRAFADHERSWFEAWQASNSYNSSGSSSSSSQHPGKGSTYQWYHKQGSRAAWEQHSPSLNSPAVAGHLFALGLASDVSLDSLSRASLRQAFHLVAKQWHPDRHSDQASKAAAEVKFKRAAEAYEELLKHSAA